MTGLFGDWTDKKLTFKLTLSNTRWIMEVGKAIIPPREYRDHAICYLIAPEEFKLGNCISVPRAISNETGFDAYVEKNNLQNTLWYIKVLEDRQKTVVKK